MSIPGVGGVPGVGGLGVGVPGVGFIGPPRIRRRRRHTGGEPTEQPKANVPAALLDSSFLSAVASPTHPRNAEAVTTYFELLARYERHELRLKARADSLDGYPDNLVAPLERVHIAGQHRRAAARLELPFEMQPEDRVTLVVLRRERIHEIATLRPVFLQIDLTVHPTPPDYLAAPVITS